MSVRATGKGEGEAEAEHLLGSLQGRELSKRHLQANCRREEEGEEREKGREEKGERKGGK